MTQQQTAPEQTASPTQEQHLIFNLFSKFLMDAANMISNNPTIDAQQCRLKLKEAQDWARSGIYAFHAPAPEQKAEVPLSEVPVSSPEEAKQEIPSV